MEEYLYKQASIRMEQLNSEINKQQLQLEKLYDVVSTIINNAGVSTVNLISVL